MSRPADNATQPIESMAACAVGHVRLVPVTEPIEKGTRPNKRSRKRNNPAAGRRRNGPKQSGTALAYLAPLQPKSIFGCGGAF
ncbi:hypothetical protein [Paenibacillus thermotolerans]|uniref:hypothetical protein n=1 Tax=Paenibacillus thermotolerans TaxID=3027807 RepID=UPI0023685DAB|nr:MULTISPECIES: hypothetical protein [unclassified Paenibacillus]